MQDLLFELLSAACTSCARCAFRVSTPKAAKSLEMATFWRAGAKIDPAQLFVYLVSRLMRKYVPLLVSAEVDVTRLFRNNQPRHSAPFSPPVNNLPITWTLCEKWVFL